MGNFGSNVSSSIVSSGSRVYIYSGGKSYLGWVGPDEAIYVYSGGILSNTTVYRGGIIYVYSGASVFNPEISDGGRLILSSGVVLNNARVTYQGSMGIPYGVVANNASVSSMGRMYVYSGGRANNTVISGGDLFVSGGVVNSTTFYYPAGRLYVCSGGTANDTTINNNGVLYVSGGGVANAPVLIYSGALTVYNGGLVNDVAISGGDLFVSGGSVSSATINSGNFYSYFSKNGRMYVYGGGKVTEITVDVGGILDVCSDGSAYCTLVSSGGGMTVSGGGFANDVYLEGGMTVSNGGSASDISIDDGGLTVSSGGVARVLYVNGGSLNVLGGGTATTIRENGGYVSYADNASVTFAANTFRSCVLYGSATVHSGTTSYQNKVTTGGYLVVSSGGSAYDTTVISGGRLVVSRGGMVNSVRVVSGGSLLVSSGGSVTNILWTPCEGIVLIDPSAKVTFTDISGVFFGSGDHLLSSAKSMSSKKISAAYSMYVMSGGTANDITISSGGNMYIYNVGVANNAVINFSGNMNVLSGGTANSARVNSGGTLFVSRGGTANNTIVNSGGVLNLSSGTTANNTVINSSGGMNVLSGGSANGAMVKAEGGLNVSFGGVATAVKESGGGVGSNFCAKLRYASNSFSSMTVIGRTATAHSGTTANSITLKSSGYLHVFSGGSASRTVLSSGGSIYVSQGGTATNIVWTPCIGSYYLEHSAYGTLASKYTGIYYGSSDQLISAVMSLTSKTVSGGSEMHVFNGGKLSSMTINENGSLTIHKGGSAMVTTISGGYVYVRGDTESGLVDEDLGVWGATDGNGGKMNTVHVKSDGALIVEVGGSATDIRVSSGGKLYLAVAPKTYARGFFVENNGISSAFINQNGQISGYTIHSTCGLNVHSGGKANKITVEDIGYLNVHRGGSASNVILSPEALLYFDVAPGTYLKASCGDSSFEMKNGVLSGYSFNYCNSVTVSSGGTVNRTLVCNYGRLTISSGGTASNTTISPYSYMEVSSGGVTINPVVNYWAELSISNGGKVTGKMTFAESARFYADCEAIFDFDLTRTSAGAEALVNDLSRLYGLPIYTLTVNGNQANGTYKLAEGASGFNRTISVVNTSGTKLGSVGVGKSVTISGKTYQLKLSGSSLTVTVGGKAISDNTAPTVSNVKANTTSTTNKSVTVTATFSDNVAVASKLYRIGTSGDWKNYSNGVTVSKNSTIYFKAVDTSGNESKVVNYKVTNISGGGSTTGDKTAPKVSNVKANITAATNKNVTVTATFSDNVSVSQKLYRIGTTGDWKNYSNGVTVSKNSTVYFKAVDASGNESKVASYKVTNIDKTAPTKPTVKANTTKATKQAVTVTATFSSDSAKKQYSLDNKTWSTYSGGVKLTKNGTVYFRGIDAVGNISQVASYKVTNIDKTAPAKPTAKASTTTATNQAVTVTATFSSDSAKKQYSLDNKTWSTYSSGVKLTKNGTVYFRGIDAAGNVSPVVSYKVSNIVAGNLILSNTTRNISAGQTSTGIAVTTGGKLNVLSGGTANKTKVDAGENDYYDYYGGDRGVLSVGKGGVANSTTVLGGGMYVESGGVANSTTVSDGGMYIKKGGKANSTTLINDGYLEVSSGGIANSVTVKSGGGLDVESGGTATKVSWTPCVGWVNWEDGAKVTFASALTGVYLGYGYKLVSHAATMSSKTLVEHEDEIPASAYDDPYAAIVGEEYFGEKMYVMSGGKANNITLKDESTLEVWSGGVASGVTLKNGSMIFVYSGGVVINAKGNGDGEIDVCSGGVMSNLTISGGTPYLTVSKGGTVKGLTASANNDSYYDFGMGGAYVESGGKITGRTRFYNGYTVSMESGAIVDFDLTLMKSPGDAALTNNLAAFQESAWDDFGNPVSTPGIVYTLTVNGNLANGTYKLAEGASGFNRTISVVNTSGKKLGTLSVGQKTTISGMSYTLKLNSGALSVAVAKTVSNQDSLSCPGVASFGGNVDSIAITPITQPAAFDGIGAEWEALATGDFNADGADDTLWRNSFIGDDGSWYSAYCTKLASEENDWRMVGVANAEEWNFLGSGDFDGDGAADIAMISSEGIVCIWGVQDGGLSSWSILSAVTSEWSFSGIADFNADGTDDIAWSNPETGLAGFWQIENRELASWANLAVVS